MRKQLDETHKWPCDYMFKFIVPKDNENEAALRAIFGLKAKLNMKESSTGKYKSFTILDRVQNADEVFSRYEAAAQIPGIISLQSTCAQAQKRLRETYLFLLYCCTVYKAQVEPYVDLRPPPLILGDPDTNDCKIQ